MTTTIFGPRCLHGKTIDELIFDDTLDLFYGTKNIGGKIKTGKLTI